MFLEVNDISKHYGKDAAEVTVLNKVDMSLEEGKMCAILGPSGSGKSTLLNLIGGLDKSDDGEIIVNGNNISKMNDKELSFYRRKNLGFVFQFYNLVANLTVRENIEVCQYLSNAPLDINELIDTLGLKEHEDKFPKQLSGGQQQRTALARALVKNPKLLLCDEPTGALDYKNAKEIICLLEKVNQKYKTSMLIVTHNEAITGMVHRVIKLHDGQIVFNEENTEIMDAADISW